MASSQASAATASQPPRLPVMDSRVTEFASKTYFEKYQQERVGVQTADVLPVPLLPESKFILPIRGLGASECEDSAAIPLLEQKRRRGFGFRFRKQTASTSETPLDSRADSIGDATRAKRFPLDQLFVSLPPELQIQIIASLPLSDILNLRLASRSWHSMITMNEVPIARYHLAHNIPAYAKRLYPVPTTSPPNFRYLCGLWHRLHVAAKLAHFISERVTKEIFLRTSETQLREFAPSKERMRRRLIPLIFTIFHFFETYREKHIQYLNDHNGMGLHRTPYTINPIEAEVMNMYDDRTLLQVHQVFPLVVASFCRRLRPPSYAGRVERSLRGYLKDKPADEVHVAALCIGGLRQVEKFWETKGYNNRRAQVDNWYKDIAQEPVEVVPANSKPKRGLMGLGRKKSMAVLNGKESSKTSGSGCDPNGGGGRRSVDSGCGGRRNSFIFTTSLSAGMPMGPLPKDHLRMLLSDLPSLQQLWLTTAEALILDRKIVERSVDIKRNAPMLMDLIRDSAMEDEDQWWYGHGGSDSIRPPLGVADDDLL